jgi:tetratricopeptide (TPR) repeat protein
MSKLLAVFILLLCGSLNVFAQTKPATAREYKKVFTTYPFSDPNPVPVMGRIYPYFRYDMFTNQPVQKEWTVVELENEFIKVWVLPEIGGKIWAAFDKTTGKPFIYSNQVVKFRDIAMRGPWTSGGIEANYGIIGHTPNCATPVDYLTRTNADGSASCFIGVLDLLTRTPWRMEIQLPADKAYFTTTSFWYNATALEQPYYTWMNAGLKAAGNLQFIYPGTNYLGHGGEHAAWPINEQNGRDLSFYEQNNFGGYKSYHVFGQYADFFGGYWHDEDFGMARYAERDDKPGKKIWIWGLSRQGMIWEKLLSDSDGQYVEVQSGRHFNQAAEGSTRTPFKHRGFAPYATDTWTEYWFPVKQTKGFVKANPYGALNVKREGDGWRLYFCPVQPIDDELNVYDGDKLILAKPLKLRPLETVTELVKLAGDGQGLRVTLGGNKLEYAADNDSEVLSRPLDAPKDFDWDSAYGHYLQGKEYARQREYVAAQRELEACLAKDKNYSAALVELAALAYRNLNYEQAADYARRALSIDTYDAAANYHFGLASLRLSKLADAKDGFELATQSVEWRSAAFTELSKLYLRGGEHERALRYADKALAFNRYDLDALQVEAVAYRAQGKRPQAEAALELLLHFDPLNHFARFEHSLWEQTAANRQAFVNPIRNELPHETLLELAAWYAVLRRWSEAEAVLQPAPAQAEVLYWQAFLRQRQRDDARAEALLAEANALPSRLVFPHRAESAEVLRWAVRLTEAWQPKYYLALILWSRNEATEAWQLLESCGSAPKADTFYAARSALAGQLNKTDQSLRDLTRAAELERQQWRYAKSLVQHYLRPEAAQPLKAQAVAQRAFEQAPENYQLGLLYAKSLLQNRQYAPANELLARLTILPYEGAGEGRALYHETQLMLALARMRSRNYGQALPFLAAAREWPERLGAGKPYETELDERLEDWLTAVCDEQLGRLAEARQIWRRLAAFKGNRNSNNLVVTAWALRKLDQPGEAAQLIDNWIKANPQNSTASACGAIWLKGEACRTDSAGDLSQRVLNEWLALGDYFKRR